MTILQPPFRSILIASQALLPCRYKIPGRERTN